MEVSRGLVLVWEGNCLLDDGGGVTVASGDLTINCGIGNCARGIALLGLKVWTCMLSWKFTLGECGWGVAAGESEFWSFVIASKFYCPLRLVVPLRVAMRSWNALMMASARVTVGCLMYLCLKYMVSERQ